MAYEAAPFFAAAAKGPDGGAAHWAQAEDGKRLRVAGWKAGVRGTVVFFNGLNEFIEKYGPTAVDMAKAGYSSATLDWRSQGMSDRLHDDPLLGYIERFADFQKDAKAFYAYLDEMGFPKPWHLVGHSMGGMIALRAVQGAHPFTSVTFSAPMWGINFRTTPKPVAHSIAALFAAFGLDTRYVFGDGPQSYVQRAPFEDNRLTHNAETYAWMKEIYAMPEVQRGGPTFKWLSESIKEIRAQRHAKRPDIPVLLVLGDGDQVIQNDTALKRAQEWGLDNVLVLSPSRHEPFMETPDVRETLIRELLKHFQAAEAA